MIDKQTTTTMINDLKIYIGETITVQNFTVRISDVTRNGVTVYDPNTGAAGTLSLEKAAEIIRQRNLKIA